MKHASSRELFTYWNAQRGDRAAPERGEIDPAAIRHSLGDIFMLAADFVEVNRFRLAGTRVCALFNRELKGEPFGPLWNEASRSTMEELLGAVIRENIGIVAGVTGHAGPESTVDLELLLLPLAHQGHARIRAMGVLGCIEVPYWVGNKALQELELRTLRHVTPVLEHANSRRFVVSREASGELTRGFRVYQGGLLKPPGEPNEKAS